MGDEYQSIPNTLEQDEKEDEEMDTIINDDNVSDMDYLRSKMVSKPIIEKEIDVEEQNEEKDDKEEKENKEEMDEDDNEEKEEKQSLFDDENIGESGRLFVRNLPFSTTEEELITHFSRFGELSEVHLPNLLKCVINSSSVVENGRFLKNN